MADSSSYTENLVNKLIISKISKAKFEEMSSSGMLDENEIYLVEDEQLDAGNQTIQNVAAPSSSTDAANKGYVDEEINGLSSSFETEINGLSSSISGKADTSALNDLASSVSSGFTDISNTIDGFSSSISDGFNGLSSSLNEKTDASSFNEFASSVSSSIADINTNLSSKLDQSAAADEWSSASSYSSGSIVVYQGQRYKCIADVAENTGWTGDTNWTPETIQEALEGIDVSSQIKGKLEADSVSVPWNATRAYQVGEVVEHDGSLWKCTTAISEPSSSSSNEWDETLWTATVEDITTKLRQKAAAPEFNPSSTYFANEYVTYNGNIYRCANAKTTASNITPENDIYNASSASANHWEVTDMTTPDATLDITSGGALRVVGADGTILWMEGYDLENASSLSGASMELSNTALKAYNFVVNSTDKISLVLPSAPSGKVGDLILDVTNPSIGDAFSESSTYSSWTQVLYGGELYSCTVAVETAGSWTGSTNWGLLYGAFNSSSSYASGDTVIYEDGVWKCKEAVSTPGAWTGDANWQTASFIIQQQSDNVISVVVPAGEEIGDMLTFAPGTMCELYFTQTAFNVDSKPTWKVVRQDVVNGGAA